MEIPFVKMNGLGNDFVFVEDMGTAWEPEQAEVERICDRHFGVGADGLILVRPAKVDGHDGYMHYFNADGSLAEMCGNGVRCFAKYLVDQNLVDAARGQMVVDTLAGPKPIEFQTDASGKMSLATVDMGEPILCPRQVPTILDANAETPEGMPYVRDAVLDSPWGPFAFTCVSMGNPHAVCFLDDFDAMQEGCFKEDIHDLAHFDVDGIGRYFESHDAFPAKANIEFAVVHPDHLEMRVYERGDGETLACGTGTCATNVAAALTGRAGRVNDVQLLGGMLHIDWREDGHVLMTGPAAESFRGVFSL